MKKLMKEAYKKDVLNLFDEPGCLYISQYSQLIEQLKIQIDADDNFHLALDKRRSLVVLQE